MKKLTKTLSVILAAVSLLSALPICISASDTPSAGMEFLRTEGDKIVNSAGETVILRGTNFGGWGIMEDWFCPISSPSGEDPVYLKLVERFGVDKTHELMKLYRENWITEQDYKNVSELGMNVVRFPIWYRNFQRDDAGTWYRDASGNIDFSEMDEAVRLCKKYGLYMIIDLHGLPGYQNDYDHCGQSKSMSFFDDTEKSRGYREIVKDFWVRFALHYKDEPVVAMYDLMNEPLGTNITTDKKMRRVFYDYLDELYDAIRAVDDKHIISMEAIWSPDALPAPDEYGWTNVVYQEHLYDVSNPAFLNKVKEIERADYGIPFLIGEFYPRGFATFGYIFSIINKRSMSWTTWTYKGAGRLAHKSTWFMYGSSDIEKIDFENDSYETLCEKFGEVLRTDSGKFTRTAFADYAGCFINGETDKMSLYTFGLVENHGPLKLRFALFIDKLTAVFTTIIDWGRKLLSGDLL